MSVKLGFYLTALALSMFGATAANADTQYINSVLEGWINSNGGQFEPTPTHNTFTGNSNGLRDNSYAVFYIPKGTYSAASVSVNPSAYGNAALSTIELFDVSVPLVDLINGTHPGTDAFADLGSGVKYGSGSLFDTYTTIGLNSGFLKDANTAGLNGDYLLIGFTNATLNALPAGQTDDDGIYIGGIGLNMAPLLLTLETSAVPESSVWAMLLAGFGIVGLSTRRRRSIRVTV